MRAERDKRKWMARHKQIQRLSVNQRRMLFSTFCTFSLNRLFWTVAGHIWPSCSAPLGAFTSAQKCAPLTATTANEPREAIDPCRRGWQGQAAVATRPAAAPRHLRRTQSAPTTARIGQSNPTTRTTASAHRAHGSSRSTQSRSPLAAARGRTTGERARYRRATGRWPAGRQRCCMHSRTPTKRARPFREVNSPNSELSNKAQRTRQLPTRQE